jgi:hypothetical protein
MKSDLELKLIAHLVDGTYELFRHRVKASPHAAPIIPPTFH